jgi:hypothetical protein
VSGTAGAATAGLVSEYLMFAGPTTPCIGDVVQAPDAYPPPAESARKVNRSQQWYTLTQIIYSAYQSCRRDAIGADPPARSYG